MRYYAVMLALIVMWFTIMPQALQLPQTGLNTETGCTTSCSGGFEEEGAPVEDNCCTNGICNPLQQCNCCSFIVTPPIVVFINRYDYKEKHLAKPVSLFLSSFNADCFHPPEAAQA